MSVTQKCSDCLYYVIKNGLCRRYPDYVRRGEYSWCGEFKADSTGNADDLRQLVSDVNDANLYGIAQLEERIDALESRIEVLERKLNHKGVEQ